MRLTFSLLLAALWPTCSAQPPKAPNLELQRASMKKLDFLVGKWAGEARVQRGPGQSLELNQTEEVQYKLDGLVMLIEGTSRNKSDGKVAFQALATVAYDEDAAAYRFRAYNDGRYLETDIKLADVGKGFTWGFTFGQVKTTYRMALTESGEWTELGEVLLEGQPPRKFVELRVRPQK
jgi:hypothetical protein